MLAAIVILITAVQAPRAPRVSLGQLQGTLVTNGSLVFHDDCFQLLYLGLREGYLWGTRRL